MKPLSETPRTDEVQHNTAELAIHARKLERELAELHKDKERLDWLITFAKGNGTRKDIDEAMKANPITL